MRIGKARGSNREFNTALLDRRITILKTIETENELGQTVRKEVVHKKVWALVEPIRGHSRDYEQLLQGRKRLIAFTRFGIRYRNDITEDMIILYENRRYNITQLTDVDASHICLEILAILEGDENEQS